ncbi:small ribosomal subunit protein eS21 isoform X1 [Manis javanica]|uniref:small ribosomal subunit protein eS21 isoform X1 n=1 Tax=Manis javanica TaxID=9974 RepID=UPI001879F48C|nr:40S ribosomal protein S21 isoform X1 [Manis javanica]
MQNDAGEFVDLYVPRKCSASNRIIGAKDHASIQMNVAEVDKATGRFNGQFKTYAICGAIRRMTSARGQPTSAQLGLPRGWTSASSGQQGESPNVIFSRVSQMTPSFDWPRLMASSQRTSDERCPHIWKICHK